MTIRMKIFILSTFAVLLSFTGSYHFHWLWACFKGTAWWEILDRRFYFSVSLKRIQILYFMTKIARFVLFADLTSTKGDSFFLTLTKSVALFRARSFKLCIIFDNSVELNPGILIVVTLTLLLRRSEWHQVSKSEKKKKL